MQILSRAEAASSAGDQQCAADFVGAGLVNRRLQGLVQRHVEGVKPLRPVEGEDAIAVALVDEKDAHCGTQCGGRQARSTALYPGFSPATETAMDVLLFLPLELRLIITAKTALGGCTMRKTLLLAGALALAMSGPAAAQNKSIKIGFVSTFSGPTAVIGNDMRNSFELALDHIGRKMGGIPV